MTVEVKHRMDYAKEVRYIFVVGLKCQTVNYMLNPCVNKVMLEWKDKIFLFFSE